MLVGRLTYTFISKEKTKLTTTLTHIAYLSCIYIDDQYKEKEKREEKGGSGREMPLPNTSAL